MRAVYQRRSGSVVILLTNRRFRNRSLNLVVLGEVLGFPPLFQPPMSVSTKMLLMLSLRHAFHPASFFPVSFFSVFYKTEPELAQFTQKS